MAIDDGGVAIRPAIVDMLGETALMRLAQWAAATVGKVMVKQIDANLEQVKTGLAWHYKQYASEQSASERALYASAED